MFNLVTFDNVIKLNMKGLEMPTKNSNTLFTSVTLSCTALLSAYQNRVVFLT